MAACRTFPGSDDLISCNKIESQKRPRVNSTPFVRQLCKGQRPVCFHNGDDKVKITKSTQVVFFRSRGDTYFDSDDKQT